jgi:hypothetical protein
VGGPEILSGRRALSDEDYVALGAIADDNEFYGRSTRRSESISPRRLSTASPAATVRP